MCLSPPKPPTPPDPKETAAAQTGTNVTTALSNYLLGNVNHVTPDGTLKYSYSGFKNPVQAPAAQSLPSAPAASEAPKGVGFNGRDETYGYDNRPGTSAYAAPQPQPAQQSQSGGITPANGGGYNVVDPTSGASYFIPETTVTVSLSPEQQAIKDQQDAAELGLATIANDATGRLGNILGQDFNYNGIAPGGDTSRLASANYTQFGSSPVLQSFLPNAGRINRSVTGAGQGIQRSVEGAGRGIQTRLGTTPGQGIQGSIESGGQRVFNLDLSGVPSFAGSASGGKITRDYGPEDGFSEDRRRVEEALLSRINPDLDRDRDALRTQLANQGIMLGSEAYDRGYDSFNRQANDARFGAVLAGGQEQSRLMGLERDRAMFQNSAQAQAFGQSHANALLRNQRAQAELTKQLAIAGFTNDAVNSQFAENLAIGNFGNAAQAQNFGQHATAMGLGNQAQAQGFGQNLAAGQFTNAAQAQGFGQRYQNAVLGNAAQAQNFGQLMDRGNFYNMNAQQMYDNDFRATSGNNMLSDQAFTREQAILNAQNNQRDREIAERTNLRNQPINEIAALLAGSQVQQPQFVNTQAGQIPTVDYAGLVQNNYGQQVANYNQQMAQRGNMWGNLLGAAGTVGSAGIGAGWF